MGDPRSPDTHVGPVTTEDQYKKILSYIDIAKQEGATCVLGGEAVEGKGWFVQPTIFTGVNNKMRIAQEEVFGPVLSVIKFRDEDEAVAIANDIQIGRATCRERVCQYVSIPLVDVSLKKNKNKQYK